MAARPPTHCCPRCGYDLSGTVEAWTDQCPIEGTCSECGLNFPWRKILDPALSNIPGCFESHMNWRWRDLWTTARLAIRPWKFWGWITLSSPPRLGRAAVATALAFLLLLAAPVLSLIAVSAAGVAALDTFTRRWGSPVTGYSTRGWLSYVYGNYGDFDNAAVLLLLPTLLFLFCAAAGSGAFLLLDRAIRKAHIRRDHVARMMVYQLAGLPLVAAPGLAMLPASWFIDALNMLEALRRPTTPMYPSAHFIDMDAVLVGGFMLTVVVAAFWFIGSWASFQGNYLKLRHAARDATILFIMSALLAMPMALITMAILMDI